MGSRAFEEISVRLRSCVRPEARRHDQIRLSSTWAALSWFVHRPNGGTFDAVGPSTPTDGVRDPFPNTFAASKAFAGSGFSGSSVRPIVISFSSFTPASTRVRAVFGGCLSAFRRVIVTHAVLGHLVVQSRPKPRGGSIACSSPRSRSDIACNASTMALSCKFAGKASSQAAYSACRPYEHSDGVVPAPGTAAMVGWTTGTDDWCSCGTRRAVARLALGVRHGSIPNRLTRHEFHSEALRHETTIRRRPHRQPTVADKLRRSSSSPTRSAPFCWPEQPQRVCGASAGVEAALPSD